MSDSEKIILKYLSTHAPATLRKIAENVAIPQMEVFHLLCTMAQRGLVERIDIPIKGNLDPDFCRKYTVKRDSFIK